MGTLLIGILLFGDSAPLLRRFSSAAVRESQCSSHCSRL
ncbi:MAG: hypothetical protein MSB11_08945 [Prevotella sp.]|nr:hypothetical protein [Prevotella sp.]